MRFVNVERHFLRETGEVSTVETRLALARERWRFWYDDRYHALVLDEYVKETRPSLRHRRWTAVEQYERIGRPRSLERVLVPPLPETVVEEARRQFVVTLKVGRAEEVGG